METMTKENLSLTAQLGGIKSNTQNLSVSNIKAQIDETLREGLFSDSNKVDLLSIVPQGFLKNFKVEADADYITSGQFTNGVRKEFIKIITRHKRGFDINSSMNKLFFGVSFDEETKETEKIVVATNGGYLVHLDIKHAFEESVLKNPSYLRDHLTKKQLSDYYRSVNAGDTLEKAGSMFDLDYSGDANTYPKWKEVVPTCLDKPVLHLDFEKVYRTLKNLRTLFGKTLVTLHTDDLHVPIMDIDYLLSVLTIFLKVGQKSGDMYFKGSKDVVLLTVPGPLDHFAVIMPFANVSEIVVVEVSV